MFIHLFILRWRPEATQAHKDRALAEVQAFQGVVPGLLETHAGVNLSPRGNGHEFGCVMKFAGQTTFEAYFSHPAHQQFLSWVVPFVEATDVDFLA